MTHLSSMMNHTSFTARRGESEYACASFFLLILAGIAAAVSVLFVSAVVFSLRLRILVGIILLVIIVSILHKMFSSTARKAYNR